MGGSGSRASKDEVLAHVADCVANQAAEMPLQCAVASGGQAAGGKGGLGDFVSKIGQAIAGAIGAIKKVLAG